MRRILSTAVGVLVLASRGLALEIPLTITERAGCDRMDNHVNSGIPLPQGAFKDTAAFSLYSQDGKAVPAEFTVRERWLKDDSVRFMTVHFSTALKANATVSLVVRDDGKAVAPPKPVTVTEAEGSVTVDSGAVKFTVKKGDWKLFDQVEVLGAPVLREPGKVVFKAEYGRTPVEKETATPPDEGEIKSAQAVVKEIAVEEKAPGRAVVLVTGAFQEEGADKLDFQARYYATAGSEAVRVVVSLINRQGKAWDQFVGIRSLGFELPANLGGDAAFAAGSSEGEDLSGALAATEKVVVLQPSSLEYSVSGKVEAKGKCRELNTQRVGWISLAGKSAEVTAAVRWFWQLHPKGLAATGDGVIKVYLVPPQREKVSVDASEYSEALRRIDLYTGAAKTHEMLFSFHKPEGAPEARARAMGVVAPLFAQCEPAWYCQKTLAFDRFYDVRLENFRPEVRDTILKYELSVDKAFAMMTARMDGKAHKNIKLLSPFQDEADKFAAAASSNGLWCTAQKVEEYGMLNFGGHAEHNDLCKENDALNSHWDGNYYDVPRACLIRYLRTGLWPFFDQAQQAASHLADLDMAHFNPADQKLNGIERTCPSVGHVRQWWPGAAFGVSGNVDSAKSQSLFELYALTGDAWYRQAGLLSGDYLVNHGGGALRAQGNRITGLYMSWRSSRDEKYRKVWAQQAANTAAGGIATGGRKAWDQFWMYGLANEGLINYFLATGDLNAAKGIQMSSDSLIYLDTSKNMGKGPRSEYNGLAGFTVSCFGYAYELTGDAKYLSYGVKRLEETAKCSPGRSKSFAQHSRISPQFLYYLATDYVAPKPVLGDKPAADPVSDAFKPAVTHEAAPKPVSDVGSM